MFIRAAPRSFTARCQRDAYRLLLKDVDNGLKCQSIRSGELRRSSTGRIRRDRLAPMTAATPPTPITTAPISTTVIASATVTTSPAISGPPTPSIPPASVPAPSCHPQNPGDAAPRIYSTQTEPPGAVFGTIRHEFTRRMEQPRLTQTRLLGFRLGWVFDSNLRIRRIRSGLVVRLAKFH
jgi:hypothetical protein